MLPPAGTEVAEFGLEATDPHLRPRKPLDDAFPCMYHRGNYLSVYLAKGKSPVLAYNWVVMTAKDGYRGSNRRSAPQPMAHRLRYCCSSSRLKRNCHQKAVKRKKRRLLRSLTPVRKVTVSNSLKIRKKLYRHVGRNFPRLQLSFRISQAH